jgi:hypothetical protein
MAPGEQIPSRQVTAVTYMVHRQSGDERRQSNDRLALAICGLEELQLLGAAREVP